MVGGLHEVMLVKFLTKHMAHNRYSIVLLERNEKKYCSSLDEAYEDGGSETDFTPCANYSIEYSCEVGSRLSGAGAIID